jgi:hypothetical protein
MTVRLASRRMGRSLLKFPHVGPPPTTISLGLIRRITPRSEKTPSLDSAPERHVAPAVALLDVGGITEEIIRPARAMGIVSRLYPRVGFVQSNVEDKTHAPENLFRSGVA